MGNGLVTLWVFVTLRSHIKAQFITSPLRGNSCGLSTNFPSQIDVCFGRGAIDALGCEQRLATWHDTDRKIYTYLTQKRKTLWPRNVNDSICSDYDMACHLHLFPRLRLLCAVSDLAFCPWWAGQRIYVSRFGRISLTSNFWWGKHFLAWFMFRRKDARFWYSLHLYTHFGKRSLWKKGKPNTSICSYLQLAQILLNRWHCHFVLSNEVFRKIRFQICVVRLGSSSP